VIETAARGAQFLLAIGIAYLIAVWFALVAWTFRDIESRSKSVFTQVFSTLLVVLFFVPGLLLYLILRPKETLDQTFQKALEEEYLLQDLDDLPLCRNCQRAVDPDFVICPHCQTHLRGPCPACARLIDLRWPICPYCAVPVEPETLPGPALGVERIRVLEEPGGGRRKRAVAAAARRVGIEAEDLDALSDALAEAAPAAVGAGERAAPRSADTSPFARARGLTGADGKITRIDDGASEGMTSPGGAPSSGPEASNRFWADPLRRRERGREAPPESPSS
jgi:RNA polymerase subunit RPABC4/transcription elongation factor Spt4